MGETAMLICASLSRFGGAGRVLMAVACVAAVTAVAGCDLAFFPAADGYYGPYCDDCGYYDDYAYYGDLYYDDYCYDCYDDWYYDDWYYGDYYYDDYYGDYYYDDGYYDWGFYGDVGWY
jgi:hypothetical protein